MYMRASMRAMQILYELQQLRLGITHLLNALLVLASIQGFFTNLYNDLTVFAFAMATFFFAWAALLMMPVGDAPNHKEQARSKLYYALAGLALALLAQTISGLVNTAANGQ